MNPSLRLPQSDGSLGRHLLSTRPAWKAPARPASTALPTRRRTSSPTRSRRSIRGSAPAIDWDATIAYRQRLWRMGLGVAEAMDTAQRGMGLDWPTSLELIRRSLDAAQRHPGRPRRVGLRHRPSGARRGEECRRRDPRIRGADGRRSSASTAA
jgi:hypothetical protein